MPTKPSIVQKGDPALRTKARAVKKEEFGSKKLLDVLKRMSEALESQYDGVAIAAPQIGETLRIFLISWKISALQNDINVDEIKDKKELAEIKKAHKDMVFINPEVVKVSKKQEWMDEGCLSVRPYYGEVKRASKCRVRAQDENGNVFEFGGSGLLAQIFQHEIDHLDGILFIDKARDIREIPPEIEINEPGP